MNQPHYKSFRIALLVFCAIVLPRCYYVEHYAVSLPFNDQWDAEGAFLLRPWIQGKLHFSALWQPHNEHRILPTRLLTLLVFIITGVWSNLTMVRVNILIAVLTPVLLTILLFQKRQLYGSRWLLIAVIMAGTALPFSWENTLLGFQNQLYFLVLFTFSALALTTYRPTNPLSIAAVAAFCSLSILTMASGLITAIAVAAVYAMNCCIHKRISIPVILLIVLFLAIAITGLVTMPHVSAHAMYRPQGISELGKAAIRILTWPLIRQYWALFPLWIPALISLILLFINSGLRKRICSWRGFLPGHYFRWRQLHLAADGFFLKFLPDIPIC